LDEPFQRYGYSKLYKTEDGCDLGFGPNRSRDIPSADSENRTVEQTGSGSDDPLQGYGHSKISTMTAGRQLGFDQF